MPRGKGQSLKLSSGELVLRAEAQFTARGYLLKAIDDVAPWVLDHLASDVLPVGGRRWHHPEKEDFPPEPTPEELEAVKGWAQHFNLDAPWVIEHAISTLAVWCLEPQLLNASRLHWPGLPGFSYWPQLPIVINWYPTLETVADLNKMVRNAKTQVRRDRVSARPDEAKRRRRHFAWAALHLCGRGPKGKVGLSYRDIVRKIGGCAGFSSISEGVEAVLRICDLA